MAIIDILTPYDAKKKAAHAAKTVKHGVSPPLLPHTPHLLDTPGHPCCSPCQLVCSIRFPLVCRPQGLSTLAPLPRAAGCHCS